MSEEIQYDDSWAEENPWTGSTSGDGTYSVQTGSNGEYLLDDEIGGILRDRYVSLSDNLEEEQKLLKILYNGYYDEDEREFLRSKLRIHYDRKLTLLLSSSLDN